MKITRLIAGARAVAEQGGVEIEIDTSMIEDPVVGSYVIVHAGYAIEVLEDEEAEGRIELFEQWDDNRDAT